MNTTRERKIQTRDPKHRAAAKARAEAYRAVTADDVRLAAVGGDARAVKDALLKNRRLPQATAKAAARLMVLCASRSRLMDEDQGPRWVEALVRLAGLRARFRRSAELWRPRRPDAEGQLAHLMRLLLCDYPLPRCWDEAVTDGRFEPVWFADVAQGVSLRRAGLPVVLNRRAAHALTVAGDDERSLVAAWRRAQVIGAGGDASLAEAVAAAPLARELTRHEAYWPAVFGALARVAFLPGQRVAPLLGYVGSLLDRDELPALDGRAVMTLLDASADWHERQTLRQRRRDRAVQAAARQRARPVTLAVPERWVGSGLGGFVGHGDPRRRPEIVELLTRRQLQDEGVAMSHCAGSYAAACAAGTVAIFSLRTGGRRLLTIEVRPRYRLIVQARGAGNRPATDGELDVIRAWARARNLSLSL